MEAEKKNVRVVELKKEHEKFVDIEIREGWIQSPTTIRFFPSESTRLKAFHIGLSLIAKQEKESRRGYCAIDESGQLKQGVLMYYKERSVQRTYHLL